MLTAAKEDIPQTAIILLLRYVKMKKNCSLKDFYLENIEKNSEHFYVDSITDKYFGSLKPFFGIIIEVDNQLFSSVFLLSSTKKFVA